MLSYVNIYAWHTVGINMKVGGKKNVCKNGKENKDNIYI